MSSGREKQNIANPVLKVQKVEPTTNSLNFKSKKCQPPQIGPKNQSAEPWSKTDRITFS